MEVLAGAPLPEMFTLAEEREAAFASSQPTDMVTDDKVDGSTSMPYEASPEDNPPDPVDAVDSSRIPQKKKTAHKQTKKETMSHKKKGKAKALLQNKVKSNPQNRKKGH